MIFAFPKRAFNFLSSLLFILFILSGILPFFLFSLSSSFAQSNEPHNLTAKIVVPYPNSLVRGDVPVYGLAYGKDFKEYILEYGAGKDPTKWISIKQSSQPEERMGKIDTVNFDLVKTIPGNLGMWVTGLSEYEYGHYAVDLPMGDYVLRLRVKALTGEEVESRVNVQVGRVALNCCPNIIKSPDGNATFYIPEHSLLEAAKVISLVPLTQIPRSLQDVKDLKPVSTLYRLQPAGESFTQKALLKIFFKPAQVTSLDHISIVVFNAELGKWDLLASSLNRKENSLVAEIETIPRDFAVYGILEGNQASNQDVTSETKPAPEGTTPLLCNNDFEQGMGQWKNKHGSKGARLEIVREGCVSGHCLKISNLPGGGNFAALAYGRSFNVRQYPWIDFDYKISSTVKINLLVKANGKWFDVVFTDDEKIYWDINMERAGKIEGVKADSQWHHIRFNLFDWLKDRTDSFIVEEIVLADWNSTGFKRLEFGNSPVGESYYIDNFRITSGQYFWQIGWNDHYSEEFSNVPFQNTNAIYTVGQPFSSFPNQLGASVKIKFEMPANSPQIPYRLTIKYLDKLDVSQGSTMRLIINNVPIASSNQYCSATRIDFILENIKSGENILEIKSAGVARRLDYVAFVPIGDIPVTLEAFSDPDNREYIFADEENTSTVGMPPLSSFNKERLAVIFTNSHYQGDLIVDITPLMILPNNSWLNQKQVRVYINNEFLEKISLGGSEVPLNIAIPARYLKNGVNTLSFASATAGQTFFIRKIALHKTVSIDQK